MPALKVLDSLVAAHNKESARPTGACVYLEPWHTDVRAVLRMKGVLAGEEASAATISSAPSGCQTCFSSA